jgi:hypothetical protein
MKEIDKLNNEAHAVEINELEQVGDVIIDQSIFTSISSHICHAPSSRRPSPGQDTGTVCA